MGCSFELFVRRGVWGVALNLMVGIVGQGWQVLPAAEQEVSCF